MLIIPTERRVQQCTKKKPRPTPTTYGCAKNDKSPHQLKIRMAVFGSGSVRSRQKEVRVFLHFANISNDNHHIQIPPKIIIQLKFCVSLQFI